jgi:hypothetical protein
VDQDPEVEQHTDGADAVRPSVPGRHGVDAGDRDGHGAADETYDDGAVGKCRSKRGAPTTVATSK